MPTLYKTPACEADLYDIWKFIAADNRDAANRFLDRLQDRFKQLLKFPELGESQSQYGRGLRSIVEGSYIVFYEPTSAGLTIHRVIHGARQWENLL